MAWNAAFAAMALLWNFSPAHAADKHDERVEQAAVARAAAKIGDLRGALGHDARLADSVTPPKRTLLPPAPPPALAPLPPMVMNDDAYMVDPIITGSNHKAAQTPLD
ncbi:MAG TPA: hypothetical protein VLQ68_02565 [Rhizobiaceae bacterium]|nr:hypothetical protein [Rhizobiaceae bacterium]